MFGEAKLKPQNGRNDAAPTLPNQGNGTFYHHQSLTIEY